MVTGSEYIAEFLARVGCGPVFTLTGGACAFIIDAVERNPKLDLICMQHEQSAAMAADVIWRTSRKVGVTIATSGPGATNLITGIACSYFDSIPTVHITGQVNQRESSSVHGAKVRQSGFQETKIVEMVLPITKYAVYITSTEELRRELPKCYALATQGRPGPVLIDVPMDIQQELMEAVFDEVETLDLETAPVDSVIADLTETLANAQRPLVLWGGGVALAGMEKHLLSWLTAAEVPFVASWAGMTAFDHDHPGYLGQIGVYGNRGANFAVQNSDALIVLGSRLDNRQRSGNAAQFAVGAVVHVVDVDKEELAKYGDGYKVSHLDLSRLSEVLPHLPMPNMAPKWTDYVGVIKSRYYGKESSGSAERLNSLSPYDVVRRLNSIIDDDAIVVADTGAALCWLFQAFRVKAHNLFTAGGNSPMGYAVPASIGAKLSRPDQQVISYNGDGGFQLNLQELQTISYLGLDIMIVIMNNSSYGIIKQFQDSYLGSRYTASRDGYSSPDFGRIAQAYGLAYERVTSLDQIKPDLARRGAIIVDVMLSEHTLIEPKLEMGRPINDQYPYMSVDDYEHGNAFVAYPRPKSMDVVACDEGG